jgi:hypothetical protein
VDGNEAAEDLLRQILMTTPLPVRRQIGQQVRGIAGELAEGAGSSRVGTATVDQAWILSTPEALRPDLPTQMERLGLVPAEFEDYLSA